MPTPQNKLPEGFEEVSITPSFIDSEAKKFGLSKSSGYRTTKHNKEVSGVSNSNHLTGQASDYIGTSENKRKFYNHLKSNYGYELKELLDEGNHLHIATKGIPEGFEEVSSKSALNNLAKNKSINIEKQQKLLHKYHPDIPIQPKEVSFESLPTPTSKPKLGRFEGYSKIGDYTEELVKKGVGWIPDFIKAGEKTGPYLMNKLGLNPNVGGGIEFSETAPGILKDFQVSPLQEAERLRKEKGLGVIESWTDPEILGHSGLSLFPGLGPMASQFSKEVKEGNYRGASQTAILMAIPFVHEKLRIAKGKGEIKDIKFERGKANDPITSFDDKTKNIIINTIKIEEAIKEGKNPAAAIDEGLHHELGHALVDNPTPENKLLIKKSARKVLKPKEVEKFEKQLDSNKDIPTEGESYKREEKVVEDLTTTGDSLRKEQLDKYTEHAEGYGDPPEIPEGFEEVEEPTKEQFISSYLDQSKKVREAEKNPNISLTKEEQLLNNKDWKSFSRSKGYTKEEIADVDKLNQLAKDAEKYDLTVDDLASLEHERLSNEQGSITPQLANNMSLGLAKFAERDLAKGLIGKSIRMSQEALELLAPRRNVPKPALDLMSRMRGSRSFAEARVKLWGEEIKKAFDKSPNDENVAFMDRVKTGQSQSGKTLSMETSKVKKYIKQKLNRPLKPDEQLQDIANYYRSLDDEAIDSWNREREKAGLDPSAYLDNHFRIFWKEIPGQVKPEGFIAKTKSLILPKRPLKGTQGMLKQHTLTTVSEGIQKGGVPVSYNPQTLMEMSYADSYKYLTALRMWNGAKDLGLRRFKKLSDPEIPGFRKISDPIAQSYFKVKEGLAKNGEWVVEDNFARILENHLSRDYLRESEIGSALVDTKNTMTMVELGLSAFHGVFEGIESSGSDIGLGLRQFVNVGLMQRNPKYLAKGAKTLIRGLTQGGVITKTKLGSDIINYLKSPEEFIKATRGEKFIKEFPEAMGILNDAFSGGMQLKMAEGYRTNWRESMKTEWKEGNYIGASILRFPPAAVERMMMPLFDSFIPRLKGATFFEEFSTALLENKKALDSGKITRPELARRTWDFIEDRFGEMNFDNLYWNNTLKTSLQFAFRSITWKLGNMRAALGGIPEQAFEVGKSMASYSRAMKIPLNKNAGVKVNMNIMLRELEIPKLTPKFSWLAGMSLNTVLISSIISKGTTGKYPWEHAKNAANLIYQIIYPRVSKDDESKRIATPTYWGDLAHLQHDPKGYITSSLSSTLTEFSDIWANKDFYGNWIYNPSDPIHKQTMDSLKYIFPTPFSIQNFSKAFKKGEPLGEALEGFAGLRKAPFYIREPDKQQYFDLRKQQEQQRKKLLKEAKGN